jgi:FixJ family two-component response regulator
MLAKQFLISIVDDDRLVRDAIASLLRAHGYLPEAFASAASFLASERRQRTDCLIADVQMPGMSGIELFGQLLACGETVPTILVTAYADDRERRRALRAGVQCYLPKPFDEIRLITCVEAALEKCSRDGRPQ